MKAAARMPNCYEETGKVSLGIYLVMKSEDQVLNKCRSAWFDSIYSFLFNSFPAFYLLYFISLGAVTG